MKAIDTLHPAAEQLQEFVLGQLPPDVREEVAQHVAECEHCCDILRQVPDDSLLNRLRNVGPEEIQTEGGARWSRGEAGHVPPELIDHPKYRILSRLGEGGMGT